jgi:hypothetical protein
MRPLQVASWASIEMPPRTTVRPRALAPGMPIGSWSMLGWFLAVMCGLLVLVFGAAHYTVIRMGEEQRQDRENRLRWATPSPPVRPQAGAGAIFAAAEAAPTANGVAAEVKDTSEHPHPQLAAPDPPADAEGAVEGVHAMISLDGQDDIEVVSSDEGTAANVCASFLVCKRQVL